MNHFNGNSALKPPLGSLRNPLLSLLSRSPDKPKITALNIKASESIKNLKIQILSNKIMDAKPPTQLVQQKFKENKAAMKKRVFVKRDKENLMNFINQTGMLQRNDNKKKRGFLELETPRLTSPHICLSARPKEISLKHIESCRNKYSPPALKKSLALHTSRADLGTWRKFSRSPGSLPGTSQIIILRNQCDFYKPRTQGNCFLGREKLYLTQVYIRKFKMQFRDYEEHTEDIDMKGFEVAKLFVTNHMVNNFISKTKKKVQGKKPTNPTQTINFDSFFAMKFKIKEREQLTSVDNLVDEYGAGSDEGFQDMHNKKWMRIINKLSDRCNIVRLNHIGYYDEVLGKPDTGERYLVDDASLNLNHVEYFFDKILKDLNTQSSRDQ